MSEATTGTLCQDKLPLLRLWYHETCRVFRDRLVNEEDRTWFDDLMKTMMLEWETTFDEVVPLQPLLYADFMMPGADVKLYELIEDKEKVCYFFFFMTLLSLIIPVIKKRISCRGLLHGVNILGCELMQSTFPVQKGEE